MSPRRPPPSLAELSVPHALTRVVATGSESTGKTELVAWLAAELGVPWSEEYARAYAEARGGSEALTARDVDDIARGQLAEETRAIDAARAAGTPLVLHDTDLLSTVIYATAYYGPGTVPPWLDDAVALRRPALYLLCDIDVPWHSDPVRDEAAIRQAMQHRFSYALEEHGARCITIRGPQPERRRRALDAIRTLL